MESFSVTFEAKDEKRHSWRWDGDDKDSRLATIYVRKSETPDAFDRARKIRVTVEVVE